MISDIILQRQRILGLIEKVGIPLSNLQSVHLFGSHYWGYDTDKSDIDLYIVVKKKQEQVKDIENLALHYQQTPQNIQKAIKKGGWGSFYTLKFASYRLFGQYFDIQKFKKEKILDYLKSVDYEKEEVNRKDRKWAFFSFIKRMFIVNYFQNNISTYKINDFQKCSQLEDEEINFLEKEYCKLMRKEFDIDEEKQDYLYLINKIEGILLKI